MGSIFEIKDSKLDNAEEEAEVVTESEKAEIKSEAQGRERRIH